MQLRNGKSQQVQLLFQKSLQSITQTWAKIFLKFKTDTAADCNVSEEVLNVALGLLARWGPYSVSACLSACLLSLHAKETLLSTGVSIPEESFAMLKCVRGKGRQPAMLGSGTWEDHSPYRQVNCRATLRADDEIPPRETQSQLFVEASPWSSTHSAGSYTTCTFGKRALNVSNIRSSICYW